MSRITLHSTTFLCHIETCKPEIHQLSQLKDRYFTAKPHQFNHYWTVTPKHTSSSRFSVGLNSLLPSSICTVHIWDATNIFNIQALYDKYFQSLKSWQILSQALPPANHLTS